MFSVRFWGTRGSIPTPGQSTRKYGGNTSCVEIEADGTLFVCDAGTGVRELGADLIERNGGPLEVHFLFSHTHWDHIQGFPFFLPAYEQENTLRIYGIENGDHTIYDLLSGQMRHDYFPVSFSDLGATVVPDHLEGGGRTIGKATVHVCEQNHPGRSLAYRVDYDGRSVVYATDHELDQDLQVDPTGDLDALRACRPDFVEFVRGADLLIMDAQYTDDEYAQKEGWGHPRASTALDLAVAGGVKQLALFHHDPMHSDSQVDAIVDANQARARRHNSDLIVFGAREGMALAIG